MNSFIFLQIPLLNKENIKYFLEKLMHEMYLFLFNIYVVHKILKKCINFKSEKESF